MNLLAAAVLAPLLAQGTLAFVPSSNLQPKVVTTALQAEKKHNHIAAASTACLVGLSLLSAQPAFANIDDVQQQQQLQQPSSTIYLAEIDQFSLPSYDSSKGSKLIDLNSEVDTINKKILSDAKGKREVADKSAEKLEADALRKAEKDGGSLMDSLIGNADTEKKQFLADERAESRANRFKTF
mmetsp:Transcript_20554/g.37084  ORF Transcript_20554/g.37084 Transcript_20554/m.37084 type:complete len:183 (-) Transcript_20554:321-869(-)|eukprot:CAMPEP_0201885686 /NCGR_PEP_ID=MMETSP0902-20130614/19771_1 /ASSEMBLY_ACC=CAM_ASM_000551 /TAXON_ID=420261 /ORGANISM="Thalassiosira antarctica, Strain CCMP982" /LENGTH=182 /DNA_ID=CAMNT_0048414995 /DNA_START=54 /DNA_END=602 /DNA_ORIENTATION=+